MYKRLGIFKSILLSYMLITLVPIGVFMYIAMDNLVNSYRNSIIDNRAANLNRVQAMLDLRLRECKSLASQISQNADISRYNLNSSTYSSYLAIEQLSRMKEANEFLLDIGVYYCGSDVLYTALGAAPPMLSLQKSYGLNELESRLVLELLNSVSAPTMVSLRSHTRVYYILPLPANYSAAYGAAVFMFDDSALRQLFYDYESEFQDQRFWINAQGELIYAWDADTQLSEAVKFLPLDGDSITIQGTTFHVLSKSSGVERDMRVVSLLNEELMTPMVGRYGTLLAVTLFLTIVCLGLSVWFALRYWNPIRELNQVLTGEVKHDISWEPIHTAMRNTMKNKHALEIRLEDQMEDQQNILRENLLLRLIHTQARPMEEIRLDLSELGFDAECVQGCVLVIHPTNGVPSRDFADAVFSMLKESYTRYACSVELDGGQRIAVLLLLLTGQGYAKANQLAQDIAQCLSLAGSSDWKIGVGRAMPLGKLNRSFLQALASLGMDGAPGRIHFIDAPDGDENLLAEQREKEKILSLAVREGDGSLALKMICEMMEYTLSNAPAVFRYTCYSLLNCVMNACSGENEILNRLPGREIWHELAELVEYSMPEEFLRRLNCVTAQVCEEFARLKQMRKDQNLRQILDFVQEQCLNKEFSLDMLSTKFGSSCSYWSRFFKEKIGLNFLDYVSKLRLDRAKMLLQETDLPVKDVAEQVGYIDTRSFIRKFKNAQGVTPGQYRNFDGKDIEP